jgi:hypothetical protein
MKENLLLAALPREERERLDPHLEPVTYPANATDRSRISLYFRQVA